jgi:hypothetical protein
MLRILPDLKNLTSFFTVPMVSTISVCRLTDYASLKPVTPSCQCWITLLLLASPSNPQLAPSVYRAVSSPRFVKKSIQYTIST